MKMQILACFVIFAIVIEQSCTAPASGKQPDLYQIGPDGSIHGGINIADSSNTADSKGGLGLSTTYSEAIDFNTKPHKGAEVYKTGTVGINLALDDPAYKQALGLRQKYRHRYKRQRTGPGLQYQRNPDGSISGSFAASQAVNHPGAEGAFGVSHTFNFGPKGSSFGGSQTAALNGRGPGGQNFGFSQTNALANSQDQNGFSSSGSNGASNQFSNPLFSSSNANANAFANSNRFNNNGFGNQFG